MKLILSKAKAGAFVIGMDDLSRKFNGIYIEGKLEDYIKLDIINEKLQLKFVKPVPEMVKIACYMIFVNTLL